MQAKVRHGRSRGEAAARPSSAHGSNVSFTAAREGREVITWFLLGIHGPPRVDDRVVALDVGGPGASVQVYEGAQVHKGSR